MIFLAKPGTALKNPTLESIDLENVSEDDLNDIFQSEEVRVFSIITD